MRVRDGHGARFTLGFLFICAAQYLLPQTTFVFLRYNFAPWLGEILHPNVSNLENVISGIILLCLGGILIFRAVERAPSSDFPADLPVTQPPNLIKFLRRHWSSLLGAGLLLGYVLYNLVQPDPSPGLVAIWIGALALLARVTFFYDREAGTSLSLRLTRWDVLWLVVLLAAGLVIGAYQLEEIPNSLVSDEGNFWDRAVAIADGRELRSFFDVGVYSYPLPGSFYQAYIFRLFGYSLWSWRFSSVLITVLTVVPLYLLARDMFNRRMAVVASVLLITLPYSLAFARMGYNNSQAVLPVALAVYLIYVALQRRSMFYFGLGGIAAGAGFYTYTAGRLGLAVTAGFLACMLVAQWFIRFRRKLPDEQRQQAAKYLPVLLLLIVVFGVMAAVTTAPHLVHTNFISPELLQYKMLESLFPNTHYALAFYPADELFRDYPPIHFGDQEFFFRPDLYVQLFARGVFHTMLSLHETTVTHSHYISAPLAGPIGVIFYFIGFVVALRNLRQREYFLIMFWFMGGLFLLSMVNTFPPRQQHFVPVIPMIALLTAIGIVTWVEFVLGRLRTLLARLAQPQRERLRPLRSPAAFALLGVVLAALVVTNLQNYFVQMPQEYLPDFENIIAWKALELEETEHFVYVYADPSRAEFIPWVIYYIPTKAEYQTISSDDLAAHHFEFAPDTDYTFFFPLQDMEVMDAFLREMEPLDPEFTSYSDVEGRTLGASVSVYVPASAEPEAG